MSMFDSGLFAILGPAFAVGVMISLINGPLGIEVLRRGIIFIDLAIAHIAGLGLIFCAVALPEAPGWALQLSVLSFVTFASISFWYLERRVPQRIEALIGVSFVLAASVTFLLLADHPHAGDLIRQLLSGQILFVTWLDVVRHVPFFGIIFLTMLLRPISKHPLTFYVLFALSITSLVQLVGIYIVFASLIIPAVVSERTAHPTAASWTLGLLSITIGITFGTILDQPVGPAIVLSYAFVSAIGLLFSMKWGSPRDGHS